MPTARKTSSRKTAALADDSNVIDHEPAGSSKAVSLIDQELNNEIANLKEQIGQTGGSNRISVTSAGDFELNGDTSLGGEIQVVVVDFATHHDFYEQAYNPNNPSPPTCYARGRNINELLPESDSPEIQSPDGCAKCPMNQWGSSLTGGNGKACKNQRMLAVLLVDPENPDAHNEPDAPLYAFKLPPTAIKYFDAAISAASRTVGHPIKAIFTVTATPVGTYSLIKFVEPVPNPDYALHHSRKPEAHDILFRKPDFAAYEAKAAAPARGRGNARAPARRARG